MSVTIQILNAVPASVLKIGQQSISLGETSTPVDISSGAVTNQSGASVDLSHFNLNGPSAQLSANGFQGAFYKVQSLHAYSWGFSKDATLTYVYAIKTHQPRPEYYPPLFPRIFLVSLPHNTDLFTITLLRPQDSFPALHLLSRNLIVNEYTQTVQQDQSPYIAAGQGSSGVNNFNDGSAGYAFNAVGGDF